MRFIVDAQLPQLLATHLTTLGHDVVHVKSLPRGGDTSDTQLTEFADRENRIVVTKDFDFQDSHLCAAGHASYYASKLATSKTLICFQFSSTTSPPLSRRSLDRTTSNSFPQR